MAFNLIDAAKDLLPQVLIVKAAGSLGESEGSIRKALNGTIPSILAGLLNKSTGSGGGTMLEIVKGAAESDMLNNLAGLFDGSGVSAQAGSGSTGSAIMNWLRSLFGDKINNIINAISGFAGIKSSSASTVLSMAVPVALAPIGNYATENNFSPSDLSSFLQSQKSSILSAIPAGFNLTGALGINSLEDIGSTISKTISPAGKYGRDRVKNVSSGNKWLWLLLLLATFAVVTWFFTRKDGKASAPTKDTTTTMIAPVPSQLLISQKIQACWILLRAIDLKIARNNQPVCL